jgi:hypothetical protein
MSADNNREVAGMKRIFAAAVSLSVLAACGDGNPFGAGSGTTPVDPGTIPETVAGSLANFSYNAAAGTLTVTGLLRDGETNPQVYVRNAALDQGVYTAFTRQDDPLDEHTTVYVRELGAVAAAVAVTGGQFNYYSGGAGYRRDGAYDPITPVAGNGAPGTGNGLVSYAGEYIGLTNVDGPGTDLLDPSASGITNASVLPGQAGLVTGQVLITVEFDTNAVAGEVYDRQVDTNLIDTATGNPIVNEAVADIVLVPTTLASDGTFSGTTELSGTRTNVGNYGGTIGGNDAEVLAGGLFAEEHFGPDGLLQNVTNEEEYGIFVLGRCGTAASAGVAGCTGADPE